jgi:glycosyltransferase involved in cell wall biosynthesis
MALISVGLPVFNGEEFLERSIGALQAQTFEDFELVVCDNASTDRTSQILGDLAAADRRIKVFRNPDNIGAAPNWNRVFHLSTSPFFKWATYDDMHAPAYLDRTLEVLRADPSVILCHTQTTLIDEMGQELARDPGTGHYRDRNGNLRYGPPAPGRARSHDPVERFRDIFLYTIRCFDAFGLMRREVLARTSLHQSYYGSDRSLLVELSLLGRFDEVPAPLFMKRDHVTTSLTLSAAERARWIDPKRAPAKLLPQRQHYMQVLRAVLHSPLTVPQKLRCLGIVAGKVNWTKLAGRFLPVVPKATLRS